MLYFFVRDFKLLSRHPLNISRDQDELLLDHINTSNVQQQQQQKQEQEPSNAFYEYEEFK